MSWTVVAYVLGGLFVLLYVLPNVLWRISRQINRYLHPQSAESLEKSPKPHEAGN